jgi:hypothetical protein
MEDFDLMMKVIVVGDGRVRIIKITISDRKNMLDYEIR